MILWSGPSSAGAELKVATQATSIMIGGKEKVGLRLELVESPIEGALQPAGIS